MQSRRRQNGHSQRVVVAMSGGVDSSVAAALLVQQGYDVVGIMMRLWSDTLVPAVPSVNRCCTPDQMVDARRVAQRLQIPFHVLDTQSQFRNTIVQHFIDEHEAGRTPNPCIACNRQIRFSFLLQHAQALGARYLATGHYARIHNVRDGLQLLKGVDQNKDQSYVLHVLNQEKLAQVLFPVGSYTKDEIREFALTFELSVATKQESQDLCFVVDGDYNGFLERHSKRRFAPGPIINQEGEHLGNHRGLPFYTIGQRKGLGISASFPVYVLKKDHVNNSITVGPRHLLERSSFTVRNLNWISGHPIPASHQIGVKVRYKARDIPGFVTQKGEETWLVSLLQPVAGITPGQGAVFYDGDICLGGGTITDDVAA